MAGVGLLTAEAAAGNRAHSGSSSSISISRYSMQSLLDDTLSFPSCPFISRAADLATILVQILGNSPKEVSVSQPLQCSSLGHVNVLGILSAPPFFCLVIHILPSFSFPSLLSYLFLPYVCIDTTLNFILNLPIEQKW